MQRPLHCLLLWWSSLLRWHHAIIIRLKELWFSKFFLFLFFFCDISSLILIYDPWRFINAQKFHKIRSILMIWWRHDEDIHKHHVRPLVMVCLGALSKLSNAINSTLDCHYIRQWFFSFSLRRNVFIFRFWNAWTNTVVHLYFQNAKLWIGLSYFVCKIHKQSVFHIQPQTKKARKKKTNRQNTCRLKLKSCRRC